MAEFTKGEWVVDNAGDVIVRGSGGYVGHPSRKGTIASLNDGEYIENNNSHDAHLIATAPDMYKEIENDLKNLKFRLENDALTECERWDIPNEIKEKEKLLSKARGE